MRSFVIQGDICWSRSPAEVATIENGYLVCQEGKSAGVYQRLPERYAGLPLLDYRGKMIIPGMIDLHIHAPQYAFRGLGTDRELLDWLKIYTFPEEAKYVSLEYADIAYTRFVANMRKSATTRAVIFATVHKEATLLLMDKLEDSGLVTLVGKVNMDCDAPDNLREKDAATSLGETVLWLNACHGRYSRTGTILTPRFLPSCSRELLSGIGELQRQWKLPVQSHLSENPGEVELVHKLFPELPFYGEGYDRHGLLGKSVPTVMAHCIYSTVQEVELLKRNQVYVAHCPSSNANLASGIAPVRSYLQQGLLMGLGSDVGSGESESMFDVLKDALKVSRLYWRIVDAEAKPLSWEEGFWLATAGGGSFFGKVGSFEPGYAMDAIVLDDAAYCPPGELTLLQRLERDIYLGADKSGIAAKFVAGEAIDLS